MPERYNDTIVILSSLVGYGSFIPALLLYKQLESEGRGVQLHAIENYYSDEKKAIFEQTRAAFRKNPKLVRIASGLSEQLEKNLSHSGEEELLRRWREEGCLRFVCFSGLWSGLLARFAESDRRVKIVFCKVDSGFSSAWKNIGPSLLQHHHTSFFNAEEGTVRYKISPQEIEPRPLNQRETAVLLHGGGWYLDGFGKQADAIGQHYTCRPVQRASDPEHNPAEHIGPIRETYTWDPLHNSNHFYTLPSYSLSGRTDREYEGLWELINGCRAIVSKPGGMTLMDSLITATPLVMLEPASRNEEDNGRLWQRLGLGIYYGDWEKENFSGVILEEMHRNLLRKRSEAPDFISCVRQQLIS
jgi:hypothetical protein